MDNVIILKEEEGSDNSSTKRTIMRFITILIAMFCGHLSIAQGPFFGGPGSGADVGILTGADTCVYFFGGGFGSGAAVATFTGADTCINFYGGGIASGASVGIFSNPYSCTTFYGDSLSGATSNYYDNPASCSSYFASSSGGSGYDNSSTFEIATTVNSGALCNGESNGTVTATITGGTPPYMYEWDNGETTATATMLAAGTHQLTVVDATGCTHVVTVIAIEPSELLVSAVQISGNVCNDESNGVATVNANGISPYTYVWDNAETMATASGLGPGAHTVTVLDATGCQKTASVIISSPPNLGITAVENSSVTCNGESNGVAIAVVTGGITPYTYNWNNAQTTATAVDLSAGIYSVTATDANGCETATTVAITEASMFEFVSAVEDNGVLCFGGNTGAATITVSGGATPYIYSWSNSEVTATAISLSAGINSVTATDANGCQLSATVFITESTEFVVTSIVEDSGLLCNGDDNGVATISVSGGAIPYSYSWDNTETTRTTTGLDGGMHSATVIDANGCTVVGAVTIAEPAAFQTTIVETSGVLCNGESNGSATATITGGATPYTYEWDNGESTAVAVMLAAGSHQLTVEDTNGCTQVGLVTITEPNVLLVSTTQNTDVLCNGESNGAATANVNGGTSPFTYTWDNSETTTTAIGLDAGVHIVSVVDANGCEGTASVTISNPALLGISAIESSGVTCNGESNGVAIATASGGTMPYTYTWDNAEMTATAVGLDVGVHSVSATDANGCETTTTVVITESAILALTSVIEDSGVLCHGESNGVATISVSGGTTPYTYAWDNAETTVTAVGLDAGVHTVTATDANGCQLSTTIVITEPTEFAMTSIIEDSGLLCNGDGNGVATISVSGGTTPYTYAWDNAEATSTTTGLNGGTHTATVTDANGCVVVGTLMIEEPAAFGIAIVEDSGVLCNGENSGSASAAVTGGTTPYTYIWDNGESTSTATMLSAGAHQLTITDVNGCKQISSVTTTEPSNLLANVVEDSGVICNGESNGIATVTAGGGTSPYTYSWDNSEITATATGLVAGIHTVTTTDNNNCAIVETVLITELGQLSATAAEDSGILCIGESNGVATATGTGGTSPYTYEWDNGESSATATMLGSGMHILSITDAEGCVETASVIITEQNGLLINTAQDSGVLCDGESNGVSTISVSGGTSPYTYIWDNSETTQTATGLTEGVHLITVSDINGCTSTSEVVISGPPAFTSALTATNPDCFFEDIGALSAMVSGGVSPYTYNWSNGATTSTITGLAADSYQVSITDANNCMQIESETLVLTNVDCGARVSIKVLLQGPYDPTTGLMTDNLRSSSLLPLEEPYTALGYQHYGLGGGEVVDPSVFNVTGPNAIVDWIFIELKDATDFSVVVATRSLLLQADGDVVDLDGTSDLTFYNVPDDNYYIVARHRNHLDIMTPGSLPMTQILNFGHDFSTGSAHGNLTYAVQMNLGGGKFGMYEADFNHDGIINAADRSLAWNNRNITGYISEDSNFSGVCDAAERSRCWNNRNLLSQVP